MNEQSCRSWQRQPFPVLPLNFNSKARTAGRVRAALAVPASAVPLLLLRAPSQTERIIMSSPTAPQTPGPSARRGRPPGSRNNTPSVARIRELEVAAREGQAAATQAQEAYVKRHCRSHPLSAPSHEIEA
ncbi:hypothetical protein NEUTE1DRAFT_135655 [Neurospora tetrasperma FGSC 2508]|uniref:Uncharacterized protein n=1 Tax=Neurospora tetrasperma (strain FGSC 2508 / ATCC MYA-4615 / P0657) TaxID=510951 RepID=F8MG23_NEUT8|nr:uncharacterized protein NEUTE1DRAFT_135655 [Neurospora tetrasperma FGSC 2508]EGO58551.1 hypothetical protein NEUTE1DRAFT_135655 [Neurospora tetrasperma FGSC 2508]EGZ72617.1 hypothetical protein NEUTE2DRAFT_62967 [Neurospora tetrasperma FGSC 2509]